VEWELCGILETGVGLGLFVFWFFLMKSLCIIRLFSGLVYIEISGKIPL